MQAAQNSIVNTVSRVTERIMTNRLANYDNIVKQFSRFFNQEDMFS